MLEELGKAASAWIEPREKGEVVDTVSEPMADMVKTFSKVGEYWLSDPKRAIEAQTSLLTSYFGHVERIGPAHVDTGEPQAAPSGPTSASPTRIGRTTRSSSFSRTPI
jgi:hypothetical protein